jgi:predicted metal-dependent hydrolase
MEQKRDRIADLTQPFAGRSLDEHYLAYFDCFNRRRFFEAHEVLEQIWLPQRRGPNGPFYKGLIQLAGAFVHLQKNRLGPAVALLKLARTNLQKFPPTHQELDLPGVLALIEDWMGKLCHARLPTDLLLSGNAPELRLRAQPSKAT